MKQFFRFFLVLGFAVSFSASPILTYADQAAENDPEASEELDAKAIKMAAAKERAEACAAAKLTAKDKKISAEERNEPNLLYKECKKEERKKKSQKCTGTGSRLSRC